MPLYEIWIAYTDDDGRVIAEEFSEDCLTLEDARKAVKDWRNGHYAAWIQDKETGEIIT